MTRLSTAIEAIAVDPARLRSGEWCHRAEKTIGEGDIHASYSADRIGMGKPVRKPFVWKGGLCVCVGIAYQNGGIAAAEAYRLVRPEMFDGEPLSYPAKVADGDAARTDLNGFYHGMRIKHAGADYVLCGPEMTFVPGASSEQLGLF